jgi:uncharacterized membrane protein
MINHVSAESFTATRSDEPLVHESLGFTEPDKVNLPSKVLNEKIGKKLIEVQEAEIVDEHWYSPRALMLNLVLPIIAVLTFSALMWHFIKAMVPAMEAAGTWAGKAIVTFGVGVCYVVAVVFGIAVIVLIVVCLFKAIRHVLSLRTDNTEYFDADRSSRQKKGSERTFNFNFYQNQNDYYS